MTVRDDIVAALIDAAQRYGAEATNSLPESTRAVLLAAWESGRIIPVVEVVASDPPQLRLLFRHVNTEPLPDVVAVQTGFQIQVFN